MRHALAFLLFVVGGRVARGEQEINIDGKKGYRIQLESPDLVETLPSPLDRMEELRKELLPQLEKGLPGNGKDCPRAGYLTLCLGEANRLRKVRTDGWTAAIEELKTFPNVLRQIYDAPQPHGVLIQDAARAEGLEKPGK